MKRKTISMRNLAKRSVSMLLTAAMLFGEPMSALAAQDVTGGDLSDYVMADYPKAEQSVHSSTVDGDESVSADDAEETVEEENTAEETTPEGTEDSPGESAAAVSDGDTEVVSDVTAGDLPQNDTQKVKAENFSIEEKNGKFYCYDSEGIMLKAESNDEKHMILFAFFNGEVTRVCVNTEGELLKGAVLFDKDGGYTTDMAKADTLYYFDQKTFRMVSEQWVEFNGGLAYIGSKGISVYDGDQKADLQGPQIGTIHGEKYYFYQGVVKTGWIYLDASVIPVKNAKDAIHTYYANTAGVLQTGEFTVAGKTYYADEDGIYKNGIKNVSSVSGTYDWYYFDANGVVCDKQIVSAKITIDDQEYEGQFYLDRDEESEAYGKGLFVGYRMEKGKLLYFNPTLVTGSDEVVQCTAWKVDPKTREQGSDFIAYVKSGTGKTAGQMIAYEDEACTKICKNILVVLDGGFFYYIGSKGTIETGFITLAEKAEDETLISYTYYFDEQTGEMNHTAGVFTYKKKRYLVSTLGGKWGASLVTADKTPAIPSLGMPEGSGVINSVGGYYCVDKKGLITTGWKTIKTSAGNKKYYFMPAGSSMYGSTVSDKSVGTMIMDNQFRVGSKTYFANDDHSVGGTAKLMCTSSGYPYAWLNADGSAKTGWIYLDAVNKDGTVPETAKLTSAKKAKWTGYYDEIEGEFCYGDNEVYVIKGKQYRFADHGRLITGWITIDGTEVYDLSVGWNGKYYSREATYYFDGAKGGAALTGWQTLPASEGSATKQKFYFMKEDTVDADGYIWQAGAKAMSVTIKIGKDLYSFDENGVGTKMSVGRVQDKSITATKAFRYFDSVTGALVKEEFRKSGSKWYYFGADGYATTEVAADAFQIPASETAVTAKFAKDGSLIGFEDPEGNAVADTTVTTPVGFVVLDKKGKPSTGLCAVARGYGEEMFYLRADGSPYATNGTSLIKIGKKYYVCNDGEIATAKSEAPQIYYQEMEDGYAVVRVYDYTMLPAADQEALTQMQAVYPGERFYVCVDDKGEVIRGKVIARESDGVAVTNRYGVIMESAFYKEGKKWYFHMPSLEGKLIYLRDVKGNYTQVNINYKANGELVSITNAATGKVMSGFYGMYCKASEADAYYDYVGGTKLSKGLPAAGKITVSAYGMKATVEIDPNVGMFRSMDS